jgi:hypothetical protein
VEKPIVRRFKNLYFRTSLIKGDCSTIELVEGVYVLCFIAARHCGGSITHIVTKEEFEYVRGKLGGWTW